MMFLNKQIIILNNLRKQGQLNIKHTLSKIIGKKKIEQIIKNKLNKIHKVKREINIIIKLNIEYQNKIKLKLTQKKNTNKLKFLHNIID